MTEPRTPRRIADHPGAELRDLLRAAAAYEPPAGAERRVWEALALRHARLCDRPDTDPQLARALSEAARLEPAPGAKARILRRIEEEALARAGLAEPRRLLESGDAAGALLAGAATWEPPPSRRVRVRGALETQRPPRFAVPLALAGLAAAAVLLVVLRPQPPEPSPIALADPPPPASTAARADDRIALESGDRRRLVLPGIGDVILSGDGAQLRLAKHDASGVRLELAHGRVSIHAEKRPKDAPLVVAAGDVEVKVVGTVFAVERAGAGADVFVYEGRVEVRSHDVFTRLGAGGSFRRATREPDADMPAWAREQLGELAGPGIAPPPSSKAPRTDRISSPASPARPAPTAAQGGPAVAPAPPSERAGAAEYIAGLRAAAAPHAKAPPETLRRLAREAADGRDREREAALLFALAQHGALTAPDRASTLLQLASLLDEALNRPWAALALRAKVARESRSHGAAAKFELAAALFELNAVEEARAAADECVRACAPGQRELAVYLRARVLQETGDPALVDAARELREVPAGRTAAALAFYERADRFFGLHQIPRARRAASFALALEPAGPHAARLRYILGDR